MRNGLYNPDCANSYVWQMIPKNAKPGQNAQYLLTREPSPKLWEMKGFTLVNPVQIGWYNAEGFYCTFRQRILCIISEVNKLWTRFQLTYLSQFYNTHLTFLLFLDYE